MERIGVLAAVLLVLVVARVSDASSRVLMDDGKEGGMLNAGKGSPSPTPALSPINSLQDSCHASLSEICHDGELLIACLQYVSKKLLLLVQNRGENDMTVTIKRPPRTNVIERHVAKGSRTTKIPITEGSDIVLGAGEWNCTLHSSRQIFDYAAQLTPIHGAYFLFVTMVIAGGAWACCKFRRGRRAADAGIPYQQLEMGAQPQSSSAVVDSNAADGWNEGWDGDWDEEAVPQPSEKHHSGSVSANGLTPRNPRKDGWEMDWDD